jgi:glycosyltransferase involved in cell wall biosynthesis
MDKIGIILTTIERPQALKKSVESIIAQWQENWILIIGLQDDYDSESFKNIFKIVKDNPNKTIRVYDLEYNCGISKARNELIQKAMLWDCEYVLLTADSITFDESMKDINNLLPCLNNYHLIGLQLNNRIAWEAKLNLIPNQSFELDFIEKNLRDNEWFIGDILFNVWFCDIVRNFWIAKTEVLLNTPYDEQLIMCEHEDFFWRLNRKGIVVGCTNLCSGTYNKIENSPEYNKIRANNFRIGQQRLKDKYSLKNWVSYKHLERTGQ